MSPLSCPARRLATALAALAMAGCAHYTPKIIPGEPVSQLEAENGAPTGRYPLPDGGSRIEYARGPYGKHTFMVDADPSGKVTGMQQVLTEANFGAIRPGMTDQEVLLRLGRPSERQPSGWVAGEYWYYRYDAPFCKWFAVGMRPEHRVRDVGYVPDPMCDVDDNDRDSR